MRRGLGAVGDDGSDDDAADHLARGRSLERSTLGRDKRSDRIGELALAHRMVKRRSDRDAAVVRVIVRAMWRRGGHHDPRDDQAPDQLHRTQRSILLRPLRRRCVVAPWNAQLPDASHVSASKPQEASHD